MFEKHKSLPIILEKNKQVNDRHNLGSLHCPKKFLKYTVVEFG